MIVPELLTGINDQTVDPVRLKRGGLFDVDSPAVTENRDRTTGEAIVGDPQEVLLLKGNALLQQYVMHLLATNLASQHLLDDFQRRCHGINGDDTSQLLTPSPLGLNLGNRRNQGINGRRLLVTGNQQANRNIDAASPQDLFGLILVESHSSFRPAQIMYIEYNRHRSRRYFSSLPSNDSKDQEHTGHSIGSQAQQGVSRKHLPNCLPQYPFRQGGN